MPKSNYFIADYETTTDENDCRVWGYGIYNIFTDEYNIDHTQTQFFNIIENTIPDKSKIYFHNLKFDGEFCINWLFENGYKHTDERALNNNEFTTLITDTGQFYTIKFKHDDKTITFIDSYKILPFSVADMSKAFGIETTKGEIDYKKHRPIGYQMTDEERDYLLRDLKIPALAMREMIEDGFTKLTASSNAFNDLKEVMGKDKFNYWFPVLTEEFDKRVRKSYKGGWTYLKDKFRETMVGKGIVLDVNSLYPYVMREKMLPYGKPKRFKGEYKVDENYPLYIVTLNCHFDIKDKHLPTLQLKNNLAFIPTQYLTTSGEEEVTLTLTNVDLKLFLDHYHVTDIEYFGGYKFKASNEIFKEFVDKWTKQKIEAEKSGNKGKRTQAKLNMNSAYGKFALSILMRNKIPYYEDGYVLYKNSKQQQRDPIFVAVASFITSYARDITIRASQENYDRFIYSDTDSIHLTGTEIPNNIHIDQYKLGAWKIEYTFTRGKYLRAKSYAEEIMVNHPMCENCDKDCKHLIPKLIIACAGLPKKARGGITIENFKIGLELKGKLKHTRVKGGVILKETTFKIRC